MDSRKIKIAVDTSSLIYLYKSDLLASSARACRFVTSTEVWDELLRGEKKLKEIDACARHVEIAPFILSSKKWEKGAFSIADKSLLEIYFQHACAAVLSEDGHILRYCKGRELIKLIKCTELTLAKIAFEKKQMVKLFNSQS